MRLIDADELIVQFRRAIETFLPNDPRRHMNLGDSLKCHGWEQGLMVIQEAPTIQPSPHWIPVTERLPEGIGRVIAQMDGGAIHDVFYKGKNPYGHVVWVRLDDCIYWDNEVVAWMPLPEPYKGVTE